LLAGAMSLGKISIYLYVKCSEIVCTATTFIHHNGVDELG